MRLFGRCGRPLRYINLFNRSMHIYFKIGCSRVRVWILLLTGYICVPKCSCIHGTSDTRKLCQANWQRRKKCTVCRYPPYNRVQWQATSSCWHNGEFLQTWLCMSNEFRQLLNTWTLAPTMFGSPGPRKSPGKSCSLWQKTRIVLIQICLWFG